MRDSKPLARPRTLNRSYIRPVRTSYSRQLKLMFVASSRNRDRSSALCLGLCFGLWVGQRTRAPTWARRPALVTAGRWGIEVRRARTLACCWGGLPGGWVPVPLVRGRFAGRRCRFGQAPDLQARWSASGTEARECKIGSLLATEHERDGPPAVREPRRIQTRAEHHLCAYGPCEQAGPVGRGELVTCSEL